MTSTTYEILAVPLRAARRASLVWAVSLALLVVMTVAFWPAFSSDERLAQILEGFPKPLLEAFGLQDFASPAGYLRGQLYAVMMPLFMAVAGMMLMNGQTASEEDSGRLEMYLALPATRQSHFLARSLVVLAWLTVIGGVLLAAQLISDAIFGLSIGTDRLIETIVLSVLLAALHAAVVAFVAGVAARPGLALGIGLALAIVGYFVAALFPLSEALEPWRVISPWVWGLGGDPLVHPAEPSRYMALIGPTAALIAAGTVAFTRRDVRAA
jgi:ABC-2 type transport system permease protein